MKYGYFKDKEGKDIYIDDKHILHNGKRLVDVIYPIGAIYISVNSTNPASLFGGKWEQIEDRFLLSCGNTYKNGAIGGSASHSHGYKIGYYPFFGTLVGTDKQSVIAYDYTTQAWKSGEGDKEMPTISSINNGIGEGTKTRGSISNYSVYADTTNENSLPPYLAVYMWKRIS